MWSDTLWDNVMRNKCDGDNKIDVSIGTKVHNKNEKVFLRPRSFVELLDSI